MICFYWPSIPVSTARLNPATLVVKELCNIPYTHLLPKRKRQTNSIRHYECCSFNDSVLSAWQFRKISGERSSTIIPSTSRLLIRGNPLLREAVCRCRPCDRFRDRACDVNHVCTTGNLRAHCYAITDTRMVNGHCVQIWLQTLRMYISIIATRLPKHKRLAWRAFGQRYQRRYVAEG